MDRRIGWFAVAVQIAPSPVVKADKSPLECPRTHRTSIVQLRVDSAPRPRRYKDDHMGH